MSAYTIYGKEMRKLILQRSPNTKVTDVIREIAYNWRRISFNEREKYLQLAKKGKAVFCDNLD